jgi:hypothetical protein
MVELEQQIDQGAVHQRREQSGQYGVHPQFGRTGSGGVIPQNNRGGSIQGLSFNIDSGPGWALAKSQKGSIALVVQEYDSLNSVVIPADDEKKIGDGTQILFNAGALAGVFVGVPVARNGRGWRATAGSALGGMLGGSKGADVGGALGQSADLNSAQKMSTKSRILEQIVATTKQPAGTHLMMISPLSRQVNKQALEGKSPEQKKNMDPIMREATEGNVNTYALVAVDAKTGAYSVHDIDLRELNSKGKENYDVKLTKVYVGFRDNQRDLMRASAETTLTGNNTPIGKTSIDFVNANEADVPVKDKKAKIDNGTIVIPGLNAKNESLDITLIAKDKPNLFGKLTESGNEVLSAKISQKEGQSSITYYVKQKGKPGEGEFGSVGPDKYLSLTITPEQYKYDLKTPASK